MVREFLHRITAPKEIARKNGRATLAQFMRSFDGGNLGRLMADWASSLSSIDKDVRTDLPALQTRAKDLFLNNSYARRFVSLCKQNIVGPNGFTLQVKSRDAKGELDEKANTIVEDAFYDWARPENCTVNGRLSFRSVQHLAITNAARDGEFLIRKVYDKSLKYGFALHVLEPYLIDHTYSAALSNGSHIRMGVELDKWGRPQAYHLLKRNLAAEVYGVITTTGDRERVPASDIYHGFLPDWSFQTRGYTWLAPAMTHMRMLSRYEFSSLINAAIAASKLGWFKPDKENPEAMQPDDQDSEGNGLIDADVGSFGTLPPGMSIEKFDTEYPKEQHEMFVRSTLRGVASALGVSYNLLANDLVGVNYSSIRAGLLDEREQWKDLQAWFTEILLERVFADWLDMALLSGQISIPNARFERLNHPVWTGRRWAWVDPKNDIEAKILEIQAGLETSTHALAEQGKDLEETYETLAKEKAKAIEYGLNLKIEEIKVSQPVPQAPADPAREARRILAELPQNGNH